MEYFFVTRILWTTYGRDLLHKSSVQISSFSLWKVKDWHLTFSLAENQEKKLGIHTYRNSYLRVLTIFRGIGYAILLLVLYNCDGWGIFKYGNISVLLIFCWTTITLVQIGTSPEMRRFLIGAQVVPSNMSLVQLLHGTLNMETNEQTSGAKPSNDIEMATI